MWRNNNQYQGLNYNNPNTASNLVQAFAITSDPQFPWTDNTDAGRPEDDGTKKRRSEELIRAQYNSINEYMNSISSVPGAVIINGDMTAFGHGDEWNKINSLVGILNRPYFYGLGNHDIQNNFNDCANNGCFYNSMWNFVYNHIFSGNRRSTVRAVDVKTRTQILGGDIEYGSFAYVLEFGKIHLIQLQHNPVMRAQARGFSIEPNFEWLRNRLEIARNSGKIIIVNVHVKENIPPDYVQLLQDYGVTAVFSGHIHPSLGTNGSVGNIPAFISGSASQSTYLILEQYSDRLEIYTVRNNNWINRALVRSINTMPNLSGIYQISTALSTSGNVLVGLNETYTNVRIWVNNNQMYQRWRLEYSNVKQAYRIYNGVPYGGVNFLNYVLTWMNNGNSRNVGVIRDPEAAQGDESYWLLEPFQNGYIFKNKKNPNLVMTVANVANGTNVEVTERYPLNTTARNQTFLLQQI
ncbi:metallophosphoesterase [Bacillus cereus]|nr:metallophosphoesterase [Bacillus cereus]